MTDQVRDSEPDWYGAEPARPPRTWDFVLTLFLVAIMVVLAVAFAITAFGTGMTNGLCQPDEGCNPQLVQIGQLVSLYAPAPIAFFATIVAIVKLVRRRVAFLAALLGLVLMTAAFAAGRLALDAGLNL